MSGFSEIAANNWEPTVEIAICRSNWLIALVRTGWASGKKNFLLQVRASRRERQLGVSDGVVKNDRVTLGKFSRSTAPARDVLEKQTFHGTTLIAVEREPIGENCYAERKVYALCERRCRCDRFQIPGFHCPLYAFSNVMGKARIVVGDAT